MDATPHQPIDGRVGHEGRRIDMDEVSKHYRVGDVDVVAFDGVNLHVDESALLVILGPSGCGKTTLLNIIGVLATAIGVMAGLAFLGWMLSSVTSTTLPDLAIEIYLSPTTIGLALAVAGVAAAGAPLLLIWRVRKMDIPSTLRVME